MDLSYVEPNQDFLQVSPTEFTFTSSTYTYFHFSTMKCSNRSQNLLTKIKYIQLGLKVDRSLQTHDSSSVHLSHSNFQSLFYVVLKSQLPPVNVLERLEQRVSFPNTCIKNLYSSVRHPSQSLSLSFIHLSTSFSGFFVLYVCNLKRVSTTQQKSFNELFCSNIQTSFLLSSPI